MFVIINLVFKIDYLLNFVIVVFKIFESKNFLKKYISFVIILKKCK